MKGSNNQLLNNGAERWRLFPFTALYYKEHGWIYDGFGRWTRRDMMVWIKCRASKYIAEAWLITGLPKLLERQNAEGIKGLQLLFSE
jgi:hypothetical protein